MKDTARHIRSRIQEHGSTPVDRMSTPGLNRVHNRSVGRPEWTKMVESALSHIKRGELQKVVLACRRELEFDGSFDLNRLQEWLLDAPDSSYRFLFRPANRTAFVGRSPECIVRKKGSSLRTESVGGTIEAGQNQLQQQKLAQRLIDNRKDQLEHSLVVRSIREHLDPLVHSVSQGEQTVRALSNVQHLCTPIHAELTDDQHVLDLVDALHPTSAVGGYPREPALNLIRRLESFDRGWYGGPIGWFDRTGDGCFAVAIRSGLMTGQSVYLYAGAGIVAGSEPDREWDEVQWKFESMTSLLTEQFSPAYPE